MESMTKRSIDHLWLNCYLVVGTPTVHWVPNYAWAYNCAPLSSQNYFELQLPDPIAIDPSHCKTNSYNLGVSFEQHVSGYFIYDNETVFCSCASLFYSPFELEQCSTMCVQVCSDLSLEMTICQVNHNNDCLVTEWAKYTNAALLLHCCPSNRLLIAIEPHQQ